MIDGTGLDIFWPVGEGLSAAEWVLFWAAAVVAIMSMAIILWPDKYKRRRDGGK